MLCKIIWIVVGLSGDTGDVGDVAGHERCEGKMEMARSNGFLLLGFAINRMCPLLGVKIHCILSLYSLSSSKHSS